MNKDHLMTSMAIKEDEEQSLRPEKLTQYIGQDDIKDMLSIYIQKKNANEPLDHMLLYGPPGLGKTTLAQVTANELNVKIKVTSGPTIEKVVILLLYFLHLNQEMYYLLTKFIVFQDLLKKFYMQQWKILY